MTDKGLISKIYKQFIELSTRETKNPMRKWEKDLNKLSPKKIYRWLSNPWKDAQHRLQLEKCKSKIQWDIISYQSECPSSKSLQIINAGKGMEKREPPWTSLEPSSIVAVNWYSHYGRRYGDSFKKKLGIEPPFAPAIPHLGIYPEETKIERDICIPLFIAALFTIARTWKQPRCPSTDEWIKKLWHIYTMEYYSAIKKECIWVSYNEVDEPRIY